MAKTQKADKLRKIEVRNKLDKDVGAVVQFYLGHTNVRLVDEAELEEHPLDGDMAESGYYGQPIINPDDELPEEGDIEEMTVTNRITEDIESYCIKSITGNLLLYLTKGGEEYKTREIPAGESGEVKVTSM